jgi:hypothetical protein
MEIFFYGDDNALFRTDLLGLYKKIEKTFPVNCFTSKTSYQKLSEEARSFLKLRFYRLDLQI